MIVKQDGPVKVVLVDRLPPEVLGKVQALYARDPRSMEEHLRAVYAEQRAGLAGVLREHLCMLDDSDSAYCVEEDAALLDDLQALMDADGSSAAKFWDTYYVGYGHKSIGDCAGGAVLGIEGLSELAAKAIQHWPLFRGQATSTRAVNVALQPLVDPVGTDASRAVQRRWVDLYTRALGPAAEEVRRRYPRQEGEDEATYGRAVAMRAFDVCRGFLPAGLTTQTSLAIDLRQLGDLLGWLRHHPLDEVRRVVEVIRSALRERYPASGSFGGSAAVSGVGERGASAEEAAARDAWDAAVGQCCGYQDDVGLDWDDRVRFRHTVDGRALAQYEGFLAARPRGCTLPHFLDDLGQVAASFLVDWGGWRDIDRQRSLVGRFPVLTGDYGFEPWYLDQLPVDLRAEAEATTAEQVRAVTALTDDPLVRQYYHPFGLRVPAAYTGGLRAWAYVLDLRTGRKIHPALRRKMLDVATAFRAEFPRVALHVDDAPDDWDIRRGRDVLVERRGT